MDWAILIGVTLVATLATALVARMLVRPGEEVGFVPTLLAIVISALVLLGAAKLALLVAGALGLAGIEAATALGGKLAVVTFAASFVPIAGYVLGFLFTARGMRGETG